MDCHTLIILGAGASMPYGFPSGKKLLQSIAMMPSEYVTAASQIDRDTFTVSGLDEFKRRLRSSNFDSIDAFISQNREFEKLGKFVVYSIIRWLEKESISIIDKSDIEGDWYRYVLNRYFDSDGCGFDGGTRILTFNYDRSLEYYLYNSLLNRRGISRVEAGEIVSGLNVYHLRGSLGPIQDSDFHEHKHVYYGKSKYSRHYGLPPEHDEALKNFDFIDFVGLSNIGVLPQDIQDWITYASNVVFLGFGYHPSNMSIFKRMFRSDIRTETVRKVRGTCLGFESAEIADLENRYLGLQLFLCDSLSFIRKEGLYVPAKKNELTKQRIKSTAK